MRGGRLSRLRQNVRTPSMPLASAGRYFYMTCTMMPLPAARDIGLFPRTKCQLLWPCALERGAARVIVFH